MNKDQIKGAAKIVAGKVQQEVGTLIESDEQVVRGLRTQVAGKAQERRGDIRDIVEHMKPKVRGNRDQIKGAAKIVAGIAQEQTGALIHSPEQVVRGLRKQVAGEAQARRGDVRDIVEQMKPRVPRKTRPRQTPA